MKVAPESRRQRMSCLFLAGTEKGALFAWIGMQSFRHRIEISGCKPRGVVPNGSLGHDRPELSLNCARDQALPFFPLFQVGKRIQQNTQLTHTLKRHPVSPDAPASHPDPVGQPDGLNIPVFKIGPGYAKIGGPSLADKDAAGSKLVDEFSVSGSSFERSARFLELRKGVRIPWPHFG